MNELLLLQGLLFMSFGNIDLFDYKTPHCFARNTQADIGRFNRVCNVPGVTEEEIQQIKSYFGSTPFTWVVDSREQSTIELLENQGLRFKTFSSGVIIDLHSLPQESFSDNVSVKEIISEDELITWCSIVAANFHKDEIEIQKAVRFLIESAPEGTIQLYLGFYKDVPVGTSMSIGHVRTINVQFVSTLEEYRRKGIGYALSVKPLIDASQRGYIQAVLMSSETGIQLYEKIGFKRYATYTIYGNY